MKDKTKNHWINHLWKGQNKNILFQFLVNKFEDDTDQCHDLNITECRLYKNSTREGDDDDKEEEVEIDREDKINKFLPY